VKYDFFKDKLIELYIQTTEPLIKKGVKWFDDFLYTYAALLNGYFYLRCKEYSIRKYVNSSPQLKAPFSKIKINVNYGKNIIIILKNILR